MERMIRKNFILEGVEGMFAGYTDGSLWNGFENPWFDEDTTIKILNALVAQNDSSQSYEWEYTSKDHSFKLWWFEGSIKVDEFEVFAPQSLPEGNLYAWGWGWCWYAEDDVLNSSANS